MNRPPKSSKKFVHVFPNGTRAVARFNKRARTVMIEWSAPLQHSQLFEYLRWRDTTLAEIGTRPGKIWADVWLQDGLCQ